jgi:hypothetical protein
MQGAVSVGKTLSRRTRLSRTAAILKFHPMIEFACSIIINVTTALEKSP